MCIRKQRRSRARREQLRNYIWVAFCFSHLGYILKMSERAQKSDVAAATAVITNLIWPGIACIQTPPLAVYMLAFKLAEICDK